MANAYHSGSVNSFADLKSAIEGHLVDEGWTLNNGIISKGGLFVLLTASANFMSCQVGTGQSGAALTDACPNPVRLINLTAADPFTFPITYDLHVNVAPDEVFCVINHSIDRYQNLSFGVSPAPGGTHGQWVNATCGTNTNLAAADAAILWPTRTAQTIGGPAPVQYDGNNTSRNFSPSLLGVTSYTGPGFSPTLQCYWIRDNAGWGPTATNLAVGAYAGSSYVASLMASLPSSYNQALVLLPMYGLKCVEDTGTAITLVVANARHCRLDNHASGEVVDFGGEKWKLYPFYRRDPSLPWPTAVRTLHTGTLGYAVRYHGG